MSSIKPCCRTCRWWVPDVPADLRSNAKGTCTEPQVGNYTTVASMGSRDPLYQAKVIPQPRGGR